MLFVLKFFFALWNSFFVLVVTDLATMMGFFAGWTTRLMYTQKERQGSYMAMAMAVPTNKIKLGKWKSEEPQPKGKASA